MVVMEDLEQYKIFWTKFLKVHDRGIRTVAIHSPVRDDAIILQEVFRNKKVYSLDITKWNLNEPFDSVFDLLIINNVVCMSHNPSRWMANIFNSCKFVIIQDMMDRKRNSDNKGMSSQFSLADSGDSMRFSFSHLNEVSQSRVRYDLSNLKSRILDVNTYKASKTLENNEPSKHFICAFKGDRDFGGGDRIIRIDDFPTGIRPILDDLEPLYEILMEFEKRELRFVLGIVPSLLTDDMIERLQTFKYLIVAQHGYNHNYKSLHKKLIDNKDVYNDWCCMDQFNEFEGREKTEIKKIINKGRERLEEIGPTNIYIPPCNKLDKNTLEALEDLKFKYILGDGISMRSEKIPIIPSHFYDRVRGLNEQNAKSMVICLHVTWEWDELYRRKDISKKDWDKKLDLLAQQPVYVPIQNAPPPRRVRPPDPLTAHNRAVFQRALSEVRQHEEAGNNLDDVDD